MKADLLKRLAKAIGEAGDPTLQKLGATIVDEQRKLGHGALAARLEELLARPPEGQPFRDLSRPNLAVLAPAKGKDPFVSVISPEELRHHMVLPPATEARFARIEAEFAARDRLAAIGLMPRRKILFYGPPGCGKSLGAERLAWNLGLPVLRVRFDSIVSSLFGETATNLRSVFVAAERQPCVLLLDECDFVAKSRTYGNDVGEAQRVVNALLQLLDEYKAPGLLVAATNLDKTLDPALFRRFDEVLEVPPPGKQQILTLLRGTLARMPVRRGVDLDAIADTLTGASAAVVVKAAEDAVKAAVLGGDKSVDERHLVQSIQELRRSP